MDRVVRIWRRPPRSGPTKMQEAIASALRLPLSRAVRSGTLLLFALCAACLLPTAAWAEIYGWTDSNGQVTYSNLPPPPGVHVTDVIHETPLSAKDVQQANYEAQIRALNDRIRLMELEETAKNRQVVDFAAPRPRPRGSAVVRAIPTIATRTGVRTRLPHSWGPVPTAASGACGRTKNIVVRSNRRRCTSPISRAHPTSLPWRRVSAVSPPLA